MEGQREGRQRVGRKEGNLSIVKCEGLAKLSDG